MFFCCTQLAFAGKVCVRFRLFEDLPFKCVALIFAFQFPDVFTELSAGLALFVVERRLVISPSCFEASGG